MDRAMLYDIIYALAARDGREERLFGRCAPLAHEAFIRSLASSGFPELWFELPLLGEPWFDLHALTARKDVEGQTSFAAERCGGCPEAFAWFAAQGTDVRQLAISWDVSLGDIVHPAVQLLVSTHDTLVTCGFLEAVGRQDASSSYRTFVERIPEGWYPCYAGVFPQRLGHHLRVECIPAVELQRTYAEDAALLERHLRQAGVRELGDTVVERCQRMCTAPFQFELQFDVRADGSTGATLGASSRFASPSDTDAWEPFTMDGPAGELMRQTEAWGLADGRWPLLAQATYAQRVTLGNEAGTLFCYPAFLKLRWRDGEPLDAKAYLIAGMEP